MGKVVDIPIGSVFGRWTVIGFTGVNKRQAIWKCRCSCPAQTEKDVPGVCLRNATSTSCGCWKWESNRKHGMTTHRGEHPGYSAWISMKQRCLNPQSPGYEKWGGRGIKIHPPWIHSFEIFWADVGSGWQPGLSFDRYPDNDEDYVPGNVRWATAKQQADNRRPPEQWNGEGFAPGEKNHLRKTQRRGYSCYKGIGCYRRATKRYSSDVLRFSFNNIRDSQSEKIAAYE